MSNRIILLSGYKGSGKDVVAEWLVTNRGYHQEAFATYAAQYCSQLYNIPYEYFREPIYKDTPITRKPIEKSIKPFIPYYVNNDFLTPRDIIKLECNIKRIININFWTDMVIESIKKSSKYDDSLTVISDVRFLDQIERIKDIFYNDDVRTVKINRFKYPPSEDITETELDTYQFDLAIDNKDTIEDLHNTLDKLF